MSADHVSLHDFDDIAMLYRQHHGWLRGWLQRFHGVASRYLPHYLGWRWIRDARRIRSPQALLKATLGDFPHLTVT